ncbi:MAG: hypothetical protein ACTHK8_10575 [Ginsengibacter sp.]
MKKIAIIGAGGLGREVFLIINAINKIKSKWDFIGFFDDGISKGTKNKYGTILGKVNDVLNFNEELDIAIAIGKPSVIKQIRTSININSKILFPNIIHPSITYFDYETIKIGEGNIISFLCLLSNDVTIGNNNFLNTRVSIGHDVKIGDYNIFNPNVQISGEVKIGSCNSFGFNSGVIQTKDIGDNNVVGAGSILMKNIGNSNTYVGNPATKLSF